MRCPTLEDVTASTLALLPRGRAWQTNEGAPRAGQEIAFNPDAYNDEAFSATEENASVIYQYWRSFAVVLHYLTQRLCDLREEFWCQSVNETRDEWMVEYGLPDACDPFPDLCTKVAAIGGTRCDYYAFIAARAGWSITCGDYFNSCGFRPGSGRRVGFIKPGRRGFGQLKIIVDLHNSPAYTGIFHAKPKAGRFKAGRRLACGPDLTPLECLLARVVHAEISIVYEAIQ